MQSEATAASKHVSFFPPHSPVIKAELAALGEHVRLKHLDGLVSKHVEQGLRTHKWNTCACVNVCVCGCVGVRVWV